MICLKKIVSFKNMNAYIGKLCLHPFTLVVQHSVAWTEIRTTPN